MSRVHETDSVIEITAQIGERQLTVAGREAWALAHLLERGEHGVTPIERPAPRWSHYIYKLRGRGVPVETITETHGGAYRGHHARYVLRCPVQVLSMKRAGEARHAA